MLQPSTAPVTAVLLAGSRPGGDPLAQAANVSTKALVPIAGDPMINHSARALLASPQVARLLILAQAPEVLLDDPATAWLGNDARVTLRVSAAGISQSLVDLMDAPDIALPLLVTTADNVLLTGAMIGHFLGEAHGADIAVGMVERRTLLALHPQARRTWLKFRGGWWSGANLFWLGSAKARSVVAFWRGVEQDRKKGLKVVAAFGPLLLLGAVTRLLSLPQALALAGRRFGLAARLVPMPQPEACIDADKPEDVTLIEAIMAQRSRRL